MSEVPTAGAGRSPHAIAALLEDPETLQALGQAEEARTALEHARRLEDEKPRGKKP